MGKLVLLSNFRDGYPEMIKKVADKESIIFSYIPSRTEFGEIYYNRVKNAYQEMGIRKFQYVDIDKKYKKEDELLILNSDIVFLAGGDDPYIIKNLISRKFDVLLRKFYANGGTIIGLCAGASTLSQYTIVSDYAGVKYEKLQIIPWGIGVNKYMYYPRFDQLCDLECLIEFCTKYNKTIIAAFCDSAILLDDTDIITFGKALLIEREKVSILKNEVNECTELTT